MRERRVYEYMVCAYIYNAHASDQGYMYMYMYVGMALTFGYNVSVSNIAKYRESDKICMCVLLKERGIKFLTTTYTHM